MQALQNGAEIPKLSFLRGISGVQGSRQAHASPTSNQRGLRLVEHKMKALERKTKGRRGAGNALKRERRPSAQMRGLGKGARNF